MTRTMAEILHPLSVSASQAVLTRGNDRSSEPGPVTPCVTWNWTV